MIVSIKLIVKKIIAQIANLFEIISKLSGMGFCLKNKKIIEQTKEIKPPIKLNLDSKL